MRGGHGIRVSLRRAGHASVGGAVATLESQESRDRPRTAVHTHPGPPFFSRLGPPWW